MKMLLGLMLLAFTNYIFADVITENVCPLNDFKEAESFGIDLLSTKNCTCNKNQGEEIIIKNKDLEINDFELVIACPSRTDQTEGKFFYQAIKKKIHGKFYVNEAQDVTEFNSFYGVSNNRIDKILNNTYKTCQKTCDKTGCGWPVIDGVVEIPKFVSVLTASCQTGFFPTTYKILKVGKSYCYKPKIE